MQTSLFGNSDCPFAPLLEPGDTHCFEPLSKGGYETISENHPDLDFRLAEIRNVGFGNVEARPVALPDLPNFIPDVGAGNGKLLATSNIQCAATTIDRLISPQKHKVSPDIHRVMNVTEDTEAVLLGYAEDNLLEGIWANRYQVASNLAKLDCIITSPDFSVFPNQPHAERLINEKRSLIFFELLQSFGARVILTIHWFGPKDLRRWAAWLNNNTAVNMVALDLQMLTSPVFWQEALTQLAEFAQLLNRKIHFLITGPSTPMRIKQVKDIFDSVSITSANPIIAAAKHRRLQAELDGGMSKIESELSVEKLVQHNLAVMDRQTGGNGRLFSKPLEIPTSYIRLGAA